MSDRYTDTQRLDYLLDNLAFYDRERIDRELDQQRAFAAPHSRTVAWRGPDKPASPLLLPEGA